MSWREAHEEAMFVVAEAHEDLRIDTTREIDVFSVIEELDLELLFRPLAGAAGLYVGPAAGRPGGILVNSRHRWARRRYTAAHELGHHLMGHEPDLEPERRGDGADAAELPPKEKLAEAFAAWFLMPPELVDAVMEDLGLARPAGPVDVYSLALRMGTSYEATALHLANLKMVPPDTARTWASMPLKKLKERLCADRPPASYQGDVWTAGAREGKSRISLAAGDRLIVELQGTSADCGAAALSRLPADIREQEPSTVAAVGGEGATPGGCRVTVDFGPAQDGNFRLSVPSPTEALPGLGDPAFTLEIEVRPPDLGRRAPVMADAPEAAGSIAPIAGHGR
jgi:hypothetical protein